jgi:hypothetical protein
MPTTDSGSKPPPEARERGISGEVGCKVKQVEFTLEQTTKAQGGVEV